MSPENGIRNSDSAMNFRIWEPKRDRTAVSSLNREQLLDATALIATLLAEDVRNAFTEPVKTSHSASFYTACAKFGTPNIIRAIQTLREIGSAMNFTPQRDENDPLSDEFQGSTG